MKRTLVLLGLVSSFCLAVSCGDDGGGGGDSLCEIGCRATIEANCSLGPSDQTECVNDCEDELVGDCSVEFNRLQQCATGESFECDPILGIPLIPACETEQNSYIDCLMIEL